MRLQAASSLGIVSPLWTWELSGRSSTWRAVVASWTFILHKGRGILGAEEPSAKRH